ncbi:hypothetical protein I551_6254 [Mycobacterium ulcerans str. Harvey]|uniref:Uncharacterized protein n=1 Tax=Mycobacterium ulcerans str. Harvey TaxID=1299332 RepID=A0ABN0QRE4_MYCUL|nr:hypothetical protein I551_6254 [Mycobacterium ulcerans str. Harvey]
MMTAWHSWPYALNSFAMSCDTSSPAAAIIAVVGLAAAALAMPIADRMSAMSAAAVVRMSGCVIT